jgi:Leucine-rich repeat (LRR) protein
LLQQSRDADGKRSSVKRSSVVVVNFPDPGLEAAIRDTTGIPTGDIYNTDFIGIQVLSFNNADIANLEGIQHCVDLVELNLRMNQIVDISPLSGLTNLTVLRLKSNKITDISALSGLTNLTELWLDSNQIVDISALSNLTNITWLALDWNKISNISALSGLTNLRELGLVSNEIVDISALSELTNLDRLYLQYNQIHDIQALVNNSGLVLGDLVYIRKNYLDLTPGSPNMLNIQILQRRGCDVDYEPQY